MPRTTNYIPLLICACYLVFNAMPASIKSEKTILQSQGITTLGETNFTTITSIDPKDLSKQLKLENEWLVLFYAGWCMHCKKFINQTYQFMKQKTDSLDFKVIPAAVQCPANPQTCKDMMIPEYPTLIYFTSKGQKFTYPSKGPRTIQDVIEFVKASHNGEAFAAKKPQTEEEKNNPTTSTPIQLLPFEGKPSAEADRENVLKIKKNLADSVEFKGFHGGSNNFQSRSQSWKRSASPTLKGMLLKKNDKAVGENVLSNPTLKKWVNKIVVACIFVIGIFWFFSKWYEKPSQSSEGILMQSDEIAEQRLCVMDGEQKSQSLPRKKIFQPKSENVENEHNSERQRFVEFEQYEEQKTSTPKKQEEENKEETPKSSFEELNDEEGFEQLDENINK